MVGNVHFILRTYMYAIVAKRRGRKREEGDRKGKGGWSVLGKGCGVVRIKFILEVRWGWIVCVSVLWRWMGWMGKGEKVLVLFLRGSTGWGEGFPQM